jgi:hypothetical protein
MRREKKLVNQKRVIPAEIVDKQIQGSPRLQRHFEECKIRSSPGCSYIRHPVSAPSRCSLEARTRKNTLIFHCTTAQYLAGVPWAACARPLRPHPRHTFKLKRREHRSTHASCSLHMSLCHTMKVRKKHRATQLPRAAPAQEAHGAR